MGMHAMHAWQSAQDMLSKLLHRQRWAVHVSISLGVHVTAQDTQTARTLALSPSLYQVQTDFHLNPHSVFDHTDQGSLQTGAWVLTFAKHSASTSDQQ